MSEFSRRVLLELDATGALPLYAVLDGARDRRVLPIVIATRAPAWCLFLGELHPDLAEVAPWLLRLGRGHAFTDDLLDQGWHDHWGIALASDAPWKELRRHLRRFLIARTEDGRRMMFRFYDPRVLRVYLPTCNAAELARFFGPVQAFATTDPTPHTFNVFQLKEGQLEHRRIVMPPPPPAAKKAPARGASV